MRSRETLLRLHRFRTEEKRRQVADIDFMIQDFMRKYEELDQQVKIEESRNGVTDPSHFNYSLSAKAARGRRDNLMRSIAELNQRLLARKPEYRKEVESQLADVAREVQADAEKFAAQKQDLERVEIRSPAAGHVMGLAVQTVGAVVQPGQKLMDVVPAEQDLLLEAHIAPHLIDKIQVGLLADVRFNTFAHSPQLVVEGKVLSISGDLVTDPQNPQLSHFLARLQITPTGKKVLGARQLQPGMPAEIIIKTGERSMLTYLLNPLTKRLAGSMKEE